MRSQTILVIDDDPALLRLLELNLDAEGYRVILASNGRTGFEALITQKPEAVIMDVILPDTNGFKLCERIREFSDVPILMLTARREEKDLVQGLDVGADDYLIKPFRREELLARLRALIRRAGFGHSDECSDDPLECNGISLDCSERRLDMGDRTVKLSHTEFKLVYLLMSNANRLLTNDELIGRVWGPEFTGDTERLRTYIRYLRQKIESDPKNPQRIVTERGIGYRFIDSGPS